MKIRIISSVIGLILLVLVMYFGNVAISVGIFVLALIGIHEFYNSVEHAGYKPVKTIGYLCCLSVLFIGLNGNVKILPEGYFQFLKSANSFSFIAFVIILALFSLIVFRHDKLNLNDISITLFGIIYVVFLFSFIVLTRGMDNGKFLIWLIFIGAWATDTFAYFTGVFLGKTKLIPAISPKKTVEGSVGGIIGCVVIMVCYGLFVNSYTNAIPLYHFAIIGVLCGFVSQVGDLAASAIKRYVKIKDYGKLMPGHGGVLDRFDSILFVAPVVYFYISFIV